MITMHYTVTDTLAAASNALNAASSTGLSYHFLIEPDGAIHQTRRPDVHAAHAGRSNWKATSGISNASSVNRDSVSISFINRGFFAKRNGTFFFDENAHGNIIGLSYPAEDVETATSLYNPAAKRNWHRFTSRQLDAARELIAALRDEYGLTELVGHDDVSIDGKSDTGPLFPMDGLREELGLSGELGLKTRVTSPQTGFLTLRRRPSSSSAEITKIANGTEIFLRSIVYSYTQANAIVVDGLKQRYLTRWASVDIEGNNRHAGFVHMRFLSATPLAPALAQKL